MTFGFPLVVVTIRSRRHLAEWALVLNLEMVTCAVTGSESLPLLATMLNGVVFPIVVLGDASTVRVHSSGGAGTPSAGMAQVHEAGDDQTTQALCRHVCIGSLSGRIQQQSA